ncbi:helix-turn-helix domain-containing protein [Jiangella alkaliphila]|nr:helix-turn-helix domain-containing protein [Jiangella alkaliphila]
MTTDDAPSLAPVGLGPFDEEVYRALLTCVDATPAALAERLGQPEGRVDSACGRLRSLGLVIRMSGRRRRYTAVDPEAALEALVRERAGELDHVRGSALALSSIFHAARRQAGDGSTIELLNGPEEQGRWFVRLQHQVRSEMMVLDRPPYVLAAVNPVEPVRLDSGVHWRAIYAPEALEIPGAMDEIDDLTRRGEQGRVLPGLPLKLAIADRRIALLPLSMELGHAQGLVIRESTLLDALVELFEVYWARATPLGSSSGGAADEAPDHDRELVRLLAAGLTDNAIARQLGLSTRTMRRRTRQLFDQLEAANRFQAGIQAARRGWL